MLGANYLLLTVRAVVINMWHYIWKCVLLSTLGNVCHEQYVEMYVVINMWKIMSLSTCGSICCDQCMEMYVMINMWKCLL